MSSQSAIKFSMLLILLLGLLTGVSQVAGQEGSFMLARVKYSGGGDWYNDPGALPNLCRFAREYAGINVAFQEARIAVTDEKLFAYPFLFITGHGMVRLDKKERDTLRRYLLSGGFLYADDDYGMDESFRQVMAQIFPERSLQELPFSHPIYHYRFDFPNGLPKIHEHDNKAPRGFGVFDDTGRMMVYYTYETNISDGWANADVHNDPPRKREEALKMGVNILIQALLN